MSHPKVTVVVVSYNTRDKLSRCLAALDPKYEVIVVDNGSTDSSAEMVERDFPSVRLIQNESNRGFGTANNQGIAQATGALILLLNSDAYAQPGAIDRLACEFQDPQVVAAGGQLLNPDGSLQNSSANELTLWALVCEQTRLEKLLPFSRVFSPYWNSRWLKSTSPTAQVMGACLMMRPVARFDERYFLYCEDTDLCKRLSKLGSIVYVPEAKFVHELGSSSSQDRWRSVARYNRGKELYFELHRGRTAAFMALIIDRKGAFIRLIGWGLASLLTLGLVGRLRGQVSLFWKVLVSPRLGPDAASVSRS